MNSPAASRIAGDFCSAALPSKAIALFATAIPLIIAGCFWPTLQSPFLLPKNAALVVVTAVLTAVVLFAGLPIPSAASAVEQRFLVSIAVFLLAMLLSGIASPQPELAVQPLLIITAGCVLMPLGAACLQGRPEWLLRGIAFAGVAVATVAIGNRFGLDLFSFVGLHSSHSAERMQITSTLGNPNFVASFVASSAAATVFLALQKNASAWLWRVGLAISAGAVGWTQSRIGVLCISIAVIVPLLGGTGRKAKWIVIALAALFAMEALYVHRANPRALSVASAGRTLVWRASLEDGISLLGDGPGTFSYVYPERMGRWFADHRDTSSLRFADMQSHAHNDFLEFMLSTGALGVSTFVLVIAFGVTALAKRCRRSHFAPVALAGVMSLLTGACFDFPLQRPETWMLLWLWMSFVFLDAGGLKSQPRRAVAALSVALFALPVGAIVLAPVVGSYLVHEGLAWEAQGGDHEAVEHYRRALQYDRTNPDAQFYLGRALANSGQADAALLQVQSAKHWVKEPEVWELQARILANSGEKAKAMGVLEDGLHRFPYAKSLVVTRLELVTASEK